MSTEKKEGFVKRIMNSLKGGDEKKVSRFHKRTVKYLDDQIRLRGSSMDDLREKLVDLQEDYNDALLTVDFDAITTTEGAKSHAITYINKLNSKKKAMMEIEEEIEVIAEEVEMLEDRKSEIGKA